MRTVFAILKRDLMRLLRNPIALSVALGVCVVPCLYAWLNVASNWDPYANTSTVPVAVVSQDKPVDIEGVGETCVGDMMLEELQHNDKIGWTFPQGEDEALAGVREGSYYAAIIIPEDFTDSLASILDGNTDKAELKYYVNEKVNAIAPKVTDTGATTLENTVNEQFTAVVGETVTDKLSGAADQISVKADASADSVSAALKEARTVLDKVDGEFDTYTQKLTDAKDSVKSASDKLNALQGKGSEASNTITGTLNDFDATRTKASNLMVDISNGLGDAATRASSLSAQSTHDISSLASDVAYAQSQVASAIAQLENDLTDNEAMVARLDETLTVVRTLEPKDGDQDAAQTIVLLEQQLSQERALLVQISDEQAAKLEELRGIAQRLENAAEEVRKLSQNVDGKVQATTNALHEAQAKAVGDDLTQINLALDSFIAVGKQLETAAKMVDPAITQTMDVAKQLTDTLEKTEGALSSTRTTLGKLKDTIDGLSKDLEVIRASDSLQLLNDLSSGDPQKVSEFLSAPVTVNEQRLYPVENYGTGIAPFFTNVAMWVGAIAYVAVFKLEPDDEGIDKMRPWQGYLARCGLFALLGTLTAIACCTGDLLLGIQCLHPFAFYLAAIVASFVFVNIGYMFAVSFRHLGNALFFLLIILQVPGSAGMYPIEMMPSFFKAINPWLPITYSNNAMREAIAGFYGHAYLHNLLMLLLFALPAIVIGIAGRNHLVNINALFDRRLRETDHLMVAPAAPLQEDHYRLATLAKALRDPQEYRELLEERSANFDAAYPRLVTRGVIALLGVPVFFFALSFCTDNKLLLIGGMVIGVALAYTYLLVLEFMRDRIERDRLLLALPPEEIDEVLTDTLQEELMPYVSITEILARKGGRRQGDSADAQTSEADAKTDDAEAEGGDEQ